tara:strand:+ start:12174 stop:15101 length:2928 start_codon:yes stop_codon:yes gene_type:complete
MAIEKNLEQPRRPLQRTFNVGGSGNTMVGMPRIQDTNIGRVGTDFGVAVSNVLNVIAQKRPENIQKGRELRALDPDLTDAEIFEKHGISRMFSNQYLEGMHEQQAVDSFSRGVNQAAERLDEVAVADPSLSPVDLSEYDSDMWMQSTEGLPDEVRANVLIRAAETRATRVANSMVVQKNKRIFDVGRQYSEGLETLDDTDTGDNDVNRWLDWNSGFRKEFVPKGSMSEREYLEAIYPAIDAKLQDPDLTDADSENLEALIKQAFKSHHGYESELLKKLRSNDETRERWREDEAADEKREEADAVWKDAMDSFEQGEELTPQQQSGLARHRLAAPFVQATNALVVLNARSPSEHNMLVAEIASGAVTYDPSLLIKSTPAQGKELRQARDAGEEERSNSVYSLWGNSLIQKIAPVVGADLDHSETPSSRAPRNPRLGIPTLYQPSTPGGPSTFSVDFGNQQYAFRSTIEGAATDRWTQLSNSARHQLLVSHRADMITEYLRWNASETRSSAEQIAKRESLLDAYTKSFSEKVDSLTLAPTVDSPVVETAMGTAPQIAWDEAANSVGSVLGVVVGTPFEAFGDHVMAPLMEWGLESPIQSPGAFPGHRIRFDLDPHPLLREPSLQETMQTKVKEFQDTFKAITSERFERGREAARGFSVVKGPGEHPFPGSLERGRTIARGLGVTATPSVDISGIRSDLAMIKGLELSPKGRKVQSQMIEMSHQLRDKILKEVKPDLELLKEWDRQAVRDYEGRARAQEVARGLELAEAPELPEIPDAFPHGSPMDRLWRATPEFQQRVRSSETRKKTKEAIKKGLEKTKETIKKGQVGTRKVVSGISIDKSVPPLITPELIAVGEHLQGRLEDTRENLQGLSVQKVDRNALEAQLEADIKDYEVFKREVEKLRDRIEVSVDETLRLQGGSKFQIPTIPGSLKRARSRARELEVTTTPDQILSLILTTAELSPGAKAMNKDLEERTGQ